MMVEHFKLELLWNKYQISRTEALQERFEVNIKIFRAVFYIFS